MNFNVFYIRKNNMDLVRSFYGQFKLILQCKYNSKTRQISNYVKFKLGDITFCSRKLSNDQS